MKRGKRVEGEACGWLLELRVIGNNITLLAPIEGALSIDPLKSDIANSQSHSAGLCRTVIRSEAISSTGRISKKTLSPFLFQKEDTRCCKLVDKIRCTKLKVHLKCESDAAARADDL